MSFTVFNFNKHLSEHLTNYGYVSPTPVQEKAIQPILDGQDLMGLAQTGTGKTAAFVLPILQHLSDSGSNKSVQSLIIAPTRELAEQIYAYIGKFSKNTNIKFCVVYGGVSRAAQIKKLKQGVDIVVGCPGRLLDLANDGALNLSKVNTLVLDEADQMLDKGFLPDIKRIIKKLPLKRQNLVFSATMPQEVRSLVNGILKDPVEVAANHTKPLTKISHTFYRTEKKHKNSLLKSILKQDDVESVIIFAKTKYKVRSLALQLEKQGFKSAGIQGNMSQQNRQKALDGFKNGTYNILVATDIAARGIDVPGVSHVINYDMPGTVEAYTHRTGRTGRASLSGEALTFTTTEDSKMLNGLERTLKKGLVFKNQPVSPMQKGTDVRSNNSEEKSPEIPRKPRQKKSQQKSRGKRSSQRNRAAAFDFGLQ